jgi:release factor glutamine methyltransferase
MTESHDVSPSPQRGEGLTLPSPRGERVCSIGTAVAEGMAMLAAAGIPEPRREARLILGLALDIDPAMALGYPERVIDGAARAQFERLIARRAENEPFARLKGSREFWSLDFALSPETLDPRPDSETLIEAALALLPDRLAPLRLLDFGTGTGCLLLALLFELPNATGLGIDIQPGAVAVALRNAKALGLESRAQFQCGDWDQGIEGKVDVILANPPYIVRSELPLLAPEVRAFEPKMALDGGIDGLNGYRALAPAAKRLLVPGGFACFELGAGQVDAASALMAESGLQIKAIRSDLAGMPRCLIATP